MAYTRMDVYPDGDPIPKNLPDSYMPAAYGAPAGQNCFTKTQMVVCSVDNSLAN